jgi:hypothetical protein
MMLLKEKEDHMLVNPFLDCFPVGIATYTLENASDTTMSLSLDESEFYITVLITSAE